MAEVCPNAWLLELWDHTCSTEYASLTMEIIAGENPIQIGGNIFNNGHLISNLPDEACAGFPC